MVLTIAMVLNMPLALDGLKLQISDVFAFGKDAENGSVWATASNAKYKEGEMQDVDIYVIADDNDIVPGNMTTMTLYLRNNTAEEITDGVLTFAGKYIEKDAGYFTDITAAAETGSNVIINGEQQVPSGEGLVYQESEAGEGQEGADAPAGQGAGLGAGNAAGGADEPAADEEAEQAEFEKDFGVGDDGEEPEEDLHVLTDICLEPGQLYEVQFDFETSGDLEKSTKASVEFKFKGETSEKKIRSEERFYYSIGLPFVDIELKDGQQIESGVTNEMNIWMNEPDWVDEKLEEKLEEEEAKKDAIEGGWEEDKTASGSNADKASNSNAGKKPDTASDSNADKKKPENWAEKEKEEFVDKFTEEALEIKESKVSYTVEVMGTQYSRFSPQKAEEVEDIGWINCIYEVTRDAAPGMYYGKVTASGKWNGKAFTSEQGFLFEVTGEGTPGTRFEAELDNVIVHASAEEGVLPRNAKIQVKELKEDDQETAAQFQDAKAALDAEGTTYDGMMALDIFFVDKDGEEIEPNGEVQVSIEMKPEALPEGVNPETVEVHHLAETDTGVEVEKVADTTDATAGTVEVKEDAADVAAVAAFSVESFSTFTVTWTSNRQSFNATVHYVDNAGNELQFFGAPQTALSISIDNLNNYKYQKAISRTDNNYYGLTRIDVIHSGTKYSSVTINGNQFKRDTDRRYTYFANGDEIYLVYSKTREPDHLSTVDTVDSASLGIKINA
ncbi:MAG: hypothetical protein Q4F29_14195, partial [Lachnospiraceae bacterium]|nr:hypothetical protein [Lachnospiraceae bacterium]